MWISSQPEEKPCVNKGVAYRQARADTALRVPDAEQLPAVPKVSERISALSFKSYKAENLAQPTSSGGLLESL